MSIPSAYQLAIESFSLDQDTLAARREVWHLLAPRMDAAVTRYLQLTDRVAPYYREMVHKNIEQHREMIVAYTAKLFQNEFDAQWVADTKERAKSEMSIGHDMRSRGVVARCILAELHEAVRKRYRYSARKVSQLIDIAERTLLLDMANAVVIHHHAEGKIANTHADRLDGAIVNFGATIENVRRAVALAVEVLSNSSSHLTAVASHAADYAASGSQAAEIVASNVVNMAASAEELARSIEEIHRQAATAMQEAEEAAAGAAHMTRTIELLSEAVLKIGSVVDVISNVASQTNLLALNATIEAARAGEKGSGFAVVASEVKSLASQTSEATRHISAQIAFIEETTRRSVEEIGSTSHTIAEIANIAKSLEGAVVEQAAATSSIAGDANQAARHAAGAADALKTVAGEVASTHDTAKSVLEAAGELSKRMREMDTAMEALLQESSKKLGLKKFVDLKVEGSAEYAGGERPVASLAKAG